MAEITIDTIEVTGAAITLTAANAGGDYILNPAGTGEVFFIVDNQDASSTDVTVTAPAATISVAGYGTLWVNDIVHSVGAGEAHYMFKAPNRRVYNDSNDQVNLTYTSVTSLTIGAFIIAADV